jgi:hypothetical protein
LIGLGAFAGADHFYFFPHFSALFRYFSLAGRFYRVFVASGQSPGRILAGFLAVARKAGRAAG